MREKKTTNYFNVLLLYVLGAVVVVCHFSLPVERIDYLEFNSTKKNE